MAGSERPLLIASGLLGLTPGHVASEQDGHDTHAAVAAFGGGPQARWETSEFTLSLASQGVRSSIVRLPPTNHGDGDNGFIATLVGIAREKGLSGYIGDGANRWPAVHRLDSARLFRLGLEAAPAGSTLHAVADEGVPVRDIAEVIGRHLDLPVVSVSPEDAGEHFTWMGGFLGLDAPASSALARELLGWQPIQPGLIEDLDQRHYFQVAGRRDRVLAFVAGSRALLVSVLVVFGLTSAARASADMWSAVAPMADHERLQPQRCSRTGKFSSRVATTASPNTSGRHHLAATC